MSDEQNSIPFTDKALLAVVIAASMLLAFVFFFAPPLALP